MSGVCTRSGPCDTRLIGPGPNWVTRVGGLPLYIRAIARALMRSGHAESEAVSLAVGIVRRWAGGAGGVSAVTRTRAANALATWEGKKAATHTHFMSEVPMTPVDLATTYVAKAMPDAVAVHRLAKAVHSWPPGPERDRARRQIARRARSLGMTVNEDDDVAGDAPSGPTSLANGPTSVAGRRALAAKGEALPGGRFPIPDATYLAKAIRAVGRAKGDHAHVRRYIMRRADQLGRRDLVPASWKPNGNRTLRARLTGR